MHERGLMERLVGRVPPRLDLPRAWWVVSVLLALTLSPILGCSRGPGSPATPATYEEAMALVEEGGRHLTAAETVPLEQVSSELHQAIEAYEAALLLLRRHEHPTEWADANLVVGSCFLKLLPEDEHGNAERAIDHFKAALRVYTEDTHPEEWALAHVNLAAALLKRVESDPEQNREEARRAAEASLRVWTRESAPEYWALAVFLLAAHAKVTENREGVIEYSRAALSVLRREAEPDRYGTVSFMLGESLLLSKEGDRAQNLREARRHLEDALTMWGQRRGTKEYAWASYCLGACYMQLTDGDADERAQNWEDAIGCFRDALRVYTSAADPEHWAAVSAGLGVSFATRVVGDHEENLAEARHHLEGARRVLPKDDDLRPYVDACLAYAVAQTREATDADLAEARALVSDARRGFEANAADPRAEVMRQLLAQTAERLNEELEE
jgi:tetratricopeptide (TPR) repeat protein